MNGRGAIRPDGTTEAACLSQRRFLYLPSLNTA
jgi:hypothetical protein